MAKLQTNTGLLPGSTWNRWDVHIHAPGTALNDQFGGDWPGYLDAIEQAEPRVVALGMTDYLSVETYRAVKAAKESGRLPEVSLLFPNIEFRVSPQTKSGAALNLHLLVDPSASDHITRIEGALARLTLKAAGETIACTELDLRRLGRIHNPAQTDSRAQYRDGVGQFKVDFQLFRQWLEGDSWLRANSLVAVAAGSNDGTSGLRQASGYSVTREEIERYADVVFSGNPADQQFWLGERPGAEAASRGLGGPKPCLHGSDAHSLTDVLLPHQERRCWIKAEPTFEGLRQTLYEPKDRVFIGPMPPAPENADAVIKALAIQGSGGWFRTPAVPLNSGLIAVIGEKGSGKTALADLVALAAGAQLDGDSFVGRASRHLAGAQAVITWGSGRVSVGAVGEAANEDAETGVRYLPQKFVDRLCGGEELSEELLTEIEQVVFEHLPSDKRLDCLTFSELRELQTRSLQERRLALDEEIGSFNREIEETNARILTLPAKRQQAVDLAAHARRLRDQYPAVDEAGSKDALQKLELLDKEERQLGTHVARLGRRREELAQLLRTIKTRAASAQALWVEVRDKLEDWECGASVTAMVREQDADQVGELMRSLGEPVNNVMSADDALAQVLTGHDAATAPADGRTLEVITGEKRELEKALNLTDALRKRLAGLRAQVNTAETAKVRLDAEIGRIDTKERERRKTFAAERLRAYAEYFNLMRDEEAVLTRLYMPLRETLAQDEKRRLELTVRRNADVEGWCARGEELFDLRKAAPLCQRGQIRDVCRRHLEEPWLESDGPGARRGIERVLDLIESGGPLKEQLRVEVTPRNLGDWLFSVGHIQMTYGLRYDGTELQKLSPGTKGVVLLLLYLAIDRNDRRPLIVDQPDENLDNRSIYEVLRPYFRAARDRRQVIIVTHNPNLVVNTDADQVIVASVARRPNGLPIIGYRSGGIESGPQESHRPSMREEICALLEGGRGAFQMRERKYRLGAGAETEGAA